MIHSKFQDHRTSGSGEDFYFFSIYGHGRHIWSSDLNYLYKLWFPLSQADSTCNLALLSQAVSG